MVERELISTIYSLKDDVLMFPHMVSPHANPKKTTVISLPPSWKSEKHAFAVDAADMRWMMLQPRIPIMSKILPSCLNHLVTKSKSEEQIVICPPLPLSYGCWFAGSSYHQTIISMPSLSWGGKLFGAASASLLALANADKSSASMVDVLDYVDPLIGTSDGGMLALRGL